MRRVLSRLAGVGLLAGCAVLIASCGSREERLPETGATVEGTVTYGNEPVQFALVILSTGGSSAQGQIGEGGKFKIHNAPLGEVKVSVNTDAGRGEYMTATMSGTYKGPDGKGAGKSSIKYVEVPKQYHDPSTTPLKMTVNKGPNENNIKIDKK